MRRSLSSHGNAVFENRTGILLSDLPERLTDAMAPEETPRVDARGARAFDATLSVPGREELKQTGMRVRVVPAPAWTPRASREAAFSGVRNRRPRLWRSRRVRVRAERGGDGAKKRLRKKKRLRGAAGQSVHARDPRGFGRDDCDRVLGAGRGRRPLGALHLIAGARGPNARLVAARKLRQADETETKGKKFQKVLRFWRKTSVPVEKNVPVEPQKAPPVPSRGEEGGALVRDSGGRPGRDDGTSTDPRRAQRRRRRRARRIRRNRPSKPPSTTRASTAARKKEKEECHFLAFETRAMAPFYHSPILAQKQLAVIFDLDETLLQAFTLSSLDRRADAIRRAHFDTGDGFLQSRAAGEASDAATDAAGKTVAGALGAQPARGLRGSSLGGRAAPGASAQGGGHGAPQARPRHAHAVRR